MGFFKRKKEDVWKDAYQGEPRVYQKPDGEYFGAFALTEETKTVLPSNPEKQFSVNGKSINEWKIMFVSTSKQDIIGDLPYSEAVKRLEAFILERKDNLMLVKELTLKELETIIVK